MRYFLKRRRALALASALAAALLAAPIPGAASPLTGDYSAVGSAIPGNACAGIFNRRGTTGFDACTAGGTAGGDPVIAKLDLESSTWTISKAFPQVAASMFRLTLAPGLTTGSWSYSPCATCPGISAFAVKGGPAFNFYSKGSAALLGIGDTASGWTSPNRSATRQYGISNIVWFGGGTPSSPIAPVPTPSTIPLPGAAWLLVGSLAGIGALARRRKPA